MKRAILFGFIIITSSSFAQQTRFINDPLATFKQAQEFYQKGNYSLAYPLFKELEMAIRETDKTNQVLNTQDIKYYAVVCALKQNDVIAEQAANNFIDVENNEPRVQMMSFQLAEYYFRKKNYASALRLYEHVNIENLNSREVADMKFHEGYGYFEQNRLDLAKPLFNAIRQMPKDPNYLDANYYYGFISFNDRNYNDALTAFKVVEEAPNYEKVVPYYIANIYLVQGKKEQALQYAEAKLKKNNQYYDLQMRQLVGNGYYEEQDFAKALPYLEQYVQQAPKVTRNDLYELSYCYYQTKNWNKAIEGFKQLGNKGDSISQNAMYLLGDAYLKTGQKTNARNAFLVCSTGNNNDSQKEIAKFNYAKLSYELGYQDVALNELQDFVKQYPNSNYNAEAKDLLIGVLANTSNYKEALSMADNMGKTSTATKRMYPRILYGRATELINDGMLLAANDMLDKALKDVENNGPVLPFLNFWKAEISYRLNKIDDAIHYYFEYLKSSKVEGEANPVNAKYNLGYCFLKKENYRQAQGFFEQIVRVPKINSESLEQDAYIRDADCYYMNRDFKTALAMYNKVLDYSWPSADYATFQRAMIAGVNNGNEKITLLNSISRKYPSSNLIADANLEIAITYLANEQYREALPFLKNIINSSGNDALKPRAYLKAGISYYNLNNSAEALNQYNALLKQYPNSPEAQDAMENAKSIYVEQGRSSEYVNFAKTMGVDISTSQEDQLAYQEAEVQFNDGNFTDAAKKFEQYIGKYPDGKYSLEANYYKSEIYYNQKDWNKAVTGYEAVADRAPNKFAEKSILQAAHLNFFELKDYANAEKYFIRLKDFATTQENKMEAMRGLLRSQYQLQKWSDATGNAQDLLNQKNISTDDRVIANMILAKSYQSNNQCETALQYFRAAASLSKAAYGAEARYEIASCLYSQNQLKDAEKAAFEVINKSGSYELWVTKSYLLLGDVYFKEKDYFNAKATYQSIIDNAKMEDLRLQAKQKLNEVADEEGKSSKVGGVNQ
ncbi:MAG TPA: tetratricopeptide repeat protein [Puia sp.]|nr:tetratricopeptide repeat protein [Puia sp.]